MKKDLFQGPKLKVERAYKHISDLQSVLIEFLKTDFYRLHVEKNVDGSNVLKFEMTGSIPQKMPLIIGDAIHNLRSALDLMTCEIIMECGGTPSRDTNFYIREKRSELVGLVENGEIKIAGCDIVTLITDYIAPYKGGNDALFGLHTLDIQDKHQLLIPLIKVASLHGVSAEDANGNGVYGMTLSVGEGGKIQPIQTASELHITDYGKPAFNIFFDKGHSLEGKSVLPTLLYLAQVVLDVIQALEKAFLARGQG